MASSGALTIRILGDASGLQRSLGQAEKQVQGFGGKAAKLGGIIGGAFAGAAVADFGRDAVKAFTESAQAQSKLELALKNSSLTVGVHAKDFERLNKELARHTLLDDDAIASTQAVMVTFGMSKQEIEKFIPTVVDLAAKMGVDGPAAADLFDKAALGSVKALKTLGIEGYKPTGDKAQDLANIQGLLHDKVKGAAQAQLDAAAPGEKLNKAMDELKETVGAKLVPALQILADNGVKVMDFMSTHPEVVVMAGALGTVAVAVWAINAATSAWASTQLALNTQLGITMTKYAPLLGALGIVGFGAADLGMDLKNDDDGWKGKLNQILGGGGESGIFGKDFLGIGDSPAPAPVTGLSGGLLLPPAPTGSPVTTNNNVTINATTSEADARLIAKEVMWNLN